MMENDALVPRDAGEPGFVMSAPFLFFDYFRIPSRPAQGLTGPDPAGRHMPRSCGQLRWHGSDGPPSPTLQWVRRERMPSDALSGRFRFDGIPVFGHVVGETTTRRWLEATGGTWSPRTPVFDAGGRWVTSIWNDDEGNVFLPFDPGEFVINYWSEGYQAHSGGAAFARARSSLMSIYYLLRPAVPRPLQLVIRSLFSRVQRARSFPAWPVETALHDLYAWLFALVADVAGTPVPWLAPWPDGYSWALVLTHDVETAFGYDNMARIIQDEIDRGYRSSWNFVPHRYQVDDAFVRRLTDMGFEVGVHGLRHDGRDVASARMVAKRLPAIRSYAERWQAAGFRAPSTQRRWDLMPQLGFDYDTSYPDTDPFEPQPGGSCSSLPYFNQAMVELPITLPQDHTLFVILRHSDNRTWIQKAEHVKAQGGMALVLTHPDYLADRSVRAAYLDLLSRLEEDATAWHALPRDVGLWWRQRQASTVRFDEDCWRVTGPAAGRGRVLFAIPSTPMAGAIPGPLTNSTTEKGWLTSWSGPGHH